MRRTNAYTTGQQRAMVPSPSARRASSHPRARLCSGASAHVALRRSRRWASMSNRARQHRRRPARLPPRTWPDELVRRLVKLAERDEVALTALRAEAAAAAGTFDLAAFRKELTSRLRVSGY